MYFLEGPHRPVWSVLRDSGFRVWGLGVKLAPRCVCPAQPHRGPQVLFHRAAGSLLLPLHGALDPSRGPLGRRHEAPSGPPPLRTCLPVIVLPHHELPGGWSLP